jgi:hypothetical protein
MSSSVVSERFRAVVCRYCSKPIRVPALVSRRESAAQAISDSTSTQYHLISRVFNVRCRCCERESVYSINQIVDFPHPVACSDPNRTAAIL